VDFYELIDREIAGNSDLGSPASRAAASEQALGADPLVADLGDRLRARGARVWHQYDGALNMVAAADPLGTIGQEAAEIPRPVAIESDGTEQYRRMTVRERSRLRPQVLERLGWRYMPLWTIEVFTDPSACADRIGGYLGLENPEALRRMRTPTGFFEDDVEHEAAVRQVHGAGAGTYSGPEPSAQELPEQTPSTWPASAEQQGTAQQGPAAGGKEAQGMGADGGFPHSSSHNGSGGNIDEVSDVREPGAPAKDASRQAVHASVAAVLPNKAAEDDPRRWGDQPNSYDHDSWLQEQKPPHWG
jgi:hypothetical protein